VPIGAPSFITSTWGTLVSFLHTIVPPAGTCTGFGLNAPLPADPTMLTAVLVEAGACGGGFEVEGPVGVDGPPPAAPPPQLTAQSTTSDKIIERTNIFFMTSAKAKRVPPSSANFGANLQEFRAGVSLDLPWP
jgi:hypothetical protein